MSRSTLRRLLATALASTLAGSLLAACDAPGAPADDQGFLSAPDDDGKEDRIGTSASSYVATQQWTPAFEAQFSAWVGALGEARANGACETLEQCFKSPAANTLWADEDATLQMFSDCGDLPYVLRAYFSYKLRLPFTFVSEIVGDRYSAGNYPVARRSHLSYRSFAALTRGVSVLVHSGFYRMAPEIEDNDFYPVDINRDTIRPGAVFYDPNGHVLVVYKVDDDGTVRFIDGHPDNSLTTARLGSQLTRGGAAQGGGFHQWRLPHAEADWTFTVSNNAASPGFSATAQYQASYAVAGRQLGYYEWVRATLKRAGAGVSPVDEFGEQLEALCDSVRARVAAVAAAQPVSLLPHPGALPENIFSTDGDWEAFSSPGRDARLKAQVRNLHELVRAEVDSVTRRDGRYAYAGTRGQLVSALKSTWRVRGQSCGIDYTNSVGATVHLTLLTLTQRLFALSFDPYHCPELRWGATGAELRSCPDDQVKRDLYLLEQRLRNLIDRDGLTATPADLGPVSPPDLDLDRLLSSL